MISNFKIKNFRLFDDIELHHLAQVNLIVGKNSAGKSALLEAFLLYFSNMSLELVIELLSARQEYWVSPQDFFPLTPVRHFFKNHCPPQLSEEGFSLSSEEDEIKVKTVAYEYDLALTTGRLLKGEELKDYNFFADDDLVKYIAYEKNEKLITLCELNQSILELREVRKKRFEFSPIPYQYVPTSGISDIQASALWDGISLTEFEAEVLVGIKLIEPNATGLTFVDSGRQGQGSSRIPLVKLSNMDEPIPLKSLGDGMTRIFHLILALVSAKDGVLIIDEFENGLHWSTQKAVWTIIFHLATRLNVQVFCSTHSRDCISGFEQVWTENKQSAGFIRVMKEEGIAKIREYDLELLSDSLETDVEVR